MSVATSSLLRYFLLDDKLHFSNLSIFSTFTFVRRKKFVQNQRTNSMKEMPPQVLQCGGHLINITLSLWVQRVYLTSNHAAMQIVSQSHNFLSLFRMNFLLL